MKQSVSAIAFLCILLTKAALAQVTIKPARPITLFTIRAIDEQTQRDVPTTFEVLLRSAKKTYRGSTTAEISTFSVKIENSDTVTVISSAEGYYTIEEDLVISCDTCGFYGYTALMERRVPTAPLVTQEDSVFRDLKVNRAIRLDKVYFDQSSYKLRPESREELEKLYRTLRDNPTLKIEIAGHTDNVGDKRLNQLLSENRARVIYNYLLQKDIASSRLNHRGYGQNRPVAPNDTEANKSLNRRVEFVVIAF